MAEVDYTVGLPVDNNGGNIMGALIVTWGPMVLNDTGKPFVCPHRADKCIQVYGTFGAAGNAKMRGSNNQIYDTAKGALSGGSAPTWATLNDPQANALDFTAAKIEGVLENPNAISPQISAGDGTTSLTVVMVISSPARL